MVVPPRIQHVLQGESAPSSGEAAAFGQADRLLGSVEEDSHRVRVGCLGIARLEAPADDLGAAPTGSPRLVWSVLAVASGVAGVPRCSCVAGTDQLAEPVAVQSREAVTAVGRSVLEQPAATAEPLTGSCRYKVVALVALSVDPMHGRRRAVCRVVVDLEHLEPVADELAPQDPGGVVPQLPVALDTGSVRIGPARVRRSVGVRSKHGPANPGGATGNDPLAAALELTFPFVVHVRASCRLQTRRDVARRDSGRVAQGGVAYL
jgi:hypothetical protein